MEKIATKRLKQFAITLPLGHPLREILLLESDELDGETFLARAKVWLQLARLRTNEAKRACQHDKYTD